MDEFGDFDSDLFGVIKQKKVYVRKSYAAKQYDPMWFTNADKEDVESARSSANWFYSQQNYSKALKYFLKASELSLLEQRDLHESIARCYAYIGDHNKAIGALKSLEQSARSFDQVTSHLNLSVHVYKTLNLWKNAVFSAQMLCILHGCDPLMWMSLAKICSSSIEDCSKQSTNNTAQLTDNFTNSCRVQDNSTDKIADSKSDGDSALLIAGRGQKKAKTATSCPLDGFHFRSEAVSLPSVTSLQCCLLTCLLRAQYLLIGVERNLKSFAIDKNKTSQQWIQGQLEHVTLDDDVISGCKKFLQKDATHEDADDKSLLQLLIKAETVFDEKWLPWVSRS